MQNDKLTGETCPICGRGTIVMVDDELQCDYCNTTVEEMK